MIALQRKWLIAAVTVASLQTAAIGWMVWDRIQLLKHGKEIILPVIPVDPRSLFRGDYVILSYEAQNIPGPLVTPELSKARPSTFYVTLAKTGDAWTPAALTTEPQTATSDRISIKARARYGWALTARARVAPVGQTTSTPAPPPVPSMSVRYGIESYFVPEGKGKPLEQMAREKKLAALIAVDAKGNAAIKGLMIDGRLQYEEPLL